MAKKIKTPEPPKYPKVFESFNEPYLLNTQMGKPTAINGVVCVRKYRITIEIVDEPIEVIQARIQELWDNCDNHHLWNPIKNEAKKYNYVLQGEFGNKIPKYYNPIKR